MLQELECWIVQTLSQAPHELITEVTSAALYCDPFYLLCIMYTLHRRQKAFEIGGAHEYNYTQKLEL